MKFFLFIKYKVKKIIFENLHIKYINYLRRLKWFILNKFVDDLKKIEGYYEKELEIRILERLIPFLASKSSSPPPITLDIGANIGIYSYYLSEFIEKFHGQCIGFEPRSDVFGRLEKNVKRKNYIAEKLALSDEIGFANLYLPATHETSSLIRFDHFLGFKAERIKLFTLDQYISLRKIPPQSIIFIKIDVEGFELKVLGGGRHTISVAKPIILCESENRHLLPQGKKVQFVIDFMQNIGYRGFAISKSLQILPINKMSNYEYFYNFWFLPEDRLDLIMEKIVHILKLLRTNNSANL